MDPQPAGAGAGGASTAMNMTCLQCFKQIRLDASLLAADFSMLGINRLAALSTQLKSQASPSASDPSGLDVSYRVCHKCTSLNDQTYARCAACGEPSRHDRLSRARAVQSMVNLHSAPAAPAADSPVDSAPRGSEHFRLRATALLRNPSPSGVGDRLTLLSKLSNLFVEASALQGLDQPLCKDCYRRLEKSLHTLLADVKTKSVNYRLALADLNEFTVESSLTPEEDAELAALEAEVATAEREMEIVQHEARDWAVREQRAGELLHGLDVRHAALLHELAVKQNLIDAHEAQLIHCNGVMQGLSRAMPLNDVFNIWFDGHFGTICTYRLGRLASVPVEWTEINAAWGMAALLLSVLGRLLSHSFSSWEPVPLGVCSRMRFKEDASLYDLNFSSDLSFGRVFYYRRFDNAIAGFLHCVGELTARITMEDPSFVFPYAIVKDKIGPLNALLSVRYQFSDEAEWTRAMKYLLTMLKFATAWLSKKRLDRK